MIYCCECNQDVKARLTDGSEIYSHRKDLASLPFWKCDECCNYVGCHHKTKDRTRPLGCIPNAEMRVARSGLHALLDTAWKSNRIGRRELYKKISEVLGYEYHTAEIKTIEEARTVYAVARKIINGLWVEL